MHDQKPLVLIADDERNAVILLTRILERDGFAVESAKDGETALEMARKLRPDLILMDVQMPYLNGFEVTRQLREDPLTARIPVIFVTAAAREPSDVEHGFKLGADDYIRKPYNHHELLARAHSKMRARQLEDRLQRRNEELEALVRIGGEFNQRLELYELTELILTVICQELRCSCAELYLFDEQERVFFWRSLEEGVRSDTEAQVMVARDGAIASQAYQTGEPILFTGCGDELDSATSTVYVGTRRFSSAAAIPLKHYGKWVGILAIGHETPEHLSDTDLRLLRSIGEQATLAIRNAQLYAEQQNYAQTLERMVEERTRELRDAQAQLLRTEKLAALGRLAASIAHEVNNPLQPIMSCLEVAIEDLENGVAVDVEGLRVAEKEVQRIKTIVSRLLDFARPSTVETVAIDMRELVEEILLLTAKQLEQMNVRVQANLYPVGLVTGSPAQLKQVILNLILNAAQAMPDGGVLEIALSSVESGIELAIADTGVGMDPQTVSQIFEPFYSTKDDGTGLGLAVSYGIIQSHNGEIRVESRLGEGSRFIIWLPYTSS